MLCEVSCKPSPQEQKIVSHIFLKNLLDYAGESGPIDIGRTIYGKPQLRDINASINFNISHSDNITVGTIHTLPVGIDIEAKNRAYDIDNEFIYSEVFTSRLEALSALKKNTFIELWTIKEAVLKASGYGLWGGLKNISISMVNHQQGRASFLNQQFEIEVVSIGTYSVAVALATFH